MPGRGRHISLFRLLYRTAVILFTGTGVLVTLPVPAQWLQVQFDQGDMAADLDQALTFQKYPTYGQYLEMMQHFALQHPEICRLDTFGTTVEGRQLLALKISDNVDQDEPEARFLYTSTMHGNELVGFVLLLRLADFLLESYGSDSEVDRLVDSLEIWINPLANPDGSYSADGDTSLEHSARVNARGIDLNRDFPDPAGEEPDDTTGREKENRHMMQFLKEHGFTLSANLHSGAEVVNYPWDHTLALHADDAWYRFVSREYADEAVAVDPLYMALFTNGITHGAQWYVINGGRQDYVNYYLEGREVTLELAEEYWLASDRLEEHWEINRRSLLNFMAQGLYGIRGRITDLTTGQPLRALVRIPDHDSSYSVVHSTALHGHFYRLIGEGSYDVVVSAPGYLDDTIPGVSVTDYAATWLEVGLQPDTTTGTPAEPEVPAIRIWPNPAGEQLHVQPSGFPRGALRLQVITPLGQVVKSVTADWQGEPLLLPLTGLEPGYYLVRITSGGLTRIRGVIRQ